MRQSNYAPRATRPIIIPREKFPPDPPDPRSLATFAASLFLHGAMPARATSLPPLSPPLVGNRVVSR